MLKSKKGYKKKEAPKLYRELLFKRRKTTINAVLPFNIIITRFITKCYFITKTYNLNFNPISCFTQVQIENLLYWVTEFKNPLKLV